jgi:hypothetical protein
MSENTAKGIITEEFQLSDGFDEVEIDFHGGEPFLAFETMRSLCEWVWHHHWKRPYLFFVTTNGTLVHGHIRDWLQARRERIYCCLSIDGTPEMHNLNRSGSFASIDIPFFQEAWPDQPKKMTVSPETLPFLADGVKYLHARNITFSCNLACGLDWPDSAPRVLAEQVKDLVDFYLSNPELEPCNLLRLPIELLGADRERGDDAVPRWCGIGDAIRAYDVDGTRYPCHSAIEFGGDGHREVPPLGGIDPLARVPSDCEDCVYKRICRTCYAANYKYSGDPTIRGWIDCWTTKVLAEATVCLFGKILAKEVLPAYLNAWSNKKLARLCVAIEQISEPRSLLTTT